MQEVALTEAARHGAEALAVQLDGGAHPHEGVGEAEAVLVHGLVHDGDPLGLGQRHHEGLLPVGHEAGVHVRLEHERVEIAAGVPEPDAVVDDVELAADLAVGVQERRQVALLGAADVDVPAGGQGGGGPRGGLVAVGQRDVCLLYTSPSPRD